MILVTAADGRRDLPEPPYNAATYLTTPTYDGSGAAVHPSVVDMGAVGWNGYRYWMAMTPYPSGNDDYENPSILASHDGLSWEVPDGLTNPIDPFPGGAAYNSDTDLVWDPDGGRMICYWRHYTGVSGATGNLTFCYSTSTDGVTWSAQADMFALTYPDDGALFSPAVVRVAADDWRMFLVGSGQASKVHTSTSPTGPWSEPAALTFNGTHSAGVTGGFWHWDITRYDGVFYGLVSSNIGALTSAKIYAITSIGGINWALNVTPVLNTRTAEWDAKLYRPTLVRARGKMRVWYSALGTDWQIGHTEIPLTEWPDPSAP